MGSTTSGIASPGRIAAEFSGGTWATEIPFPAGGPARVYDLAVRLELGMPRHPYHPPFSYALAKAHGQNPYPNGISAASEMLTMGAHVGTHVDALGHIALDGEVYGGREVIDRQSASCGLEVASVEELPPLIGPGYLVDAPLLFGRDLTPADGIGPDELSAWFTERREPGPGSVVLVRTGWMRHWPDVDAYLGLKTGLPGVTLAGAQWLSERGILATGSDTMNYEHKPVPTTVALSVHVHNLVHSGIPIMESLDLETLAAARVNEFFFVALPLRIRGGTGSPIRPVAIAPA